MISTSYEILSLREQAGIVNGWLEHRMREVLPHIMEREGFDMWIVAGEEYNEGPVLMTLLPAEMISARRKTILVFHRTGDNEMEHMLVGRHGILEQYGLGKFYTEEWNRDAEEQWECVARLIKERDPARIGINVSDTFAFGDGLTHSEYESLVDVLDQKYVSRLEGAERLAVGWLEKRTGPELDAYWRVVEIAHAIIEDAFSTKVIHPGVTTTDDVVWWMRQKVQDMGFRSWFQPSISIQAPDVPFRSKDARRLIRPGDLLHCDFGIQYLGLCTDTQQFAYVLRSGEREVPTGLREALATANRLQDIHAGEMVPGRTGNEILASALQRARDEGIDGMIYTHPIGYHGHGAGPTIGLTDRQEGVPGKGDYELFDDTCYAMELNIKGQVPEWGGCTVRIGLEQDVAFTGGEVLYIAGRQTEFHLIG